jgi:hypothetical protein
MSSIQLWQFLRPQLIPVILCFLRYIHVLLRCYRGLLLVFLLLRYRHQIRHAWRRRRQRRVLWDRHQHWHRAWHGARLGNHHWLLQHGLLNVDDLGPRPAPSMDGDAVDDEEGEVDESMRRSVSN